MAGQKSRTPRVVAVTGASAGVGRATAQAFAAQGDALGLIARGGAGLEAAAAEIQAAGGQAVWVSADVSDAAAVEAAATQATLRRMLPRDAGVIVQVGSALAERGIPLQSAYCSAKLAIQGFCESLRCELLHDGSLVHAKSACSG